MNKENKIELERILTSALRAKEPGPFGEVRITDDGKFAVLFHASGKQTRRKLSHYGLEFLRNGEAVLASHESFLEPEESC